MLTIETVTCGYGRGARPVLQDLSLSFRPGVMTALVGPNGCGKSTLLKAIMGFLALEAGSITLNGRPVASFKRKVLARHIAYLPQENHCPEYLTVAELVELGGFSRQTLLGSTRATDRMRFEEVLDLVDLTAQAHLPVNKLSGGQRQRAWIAMILAQDADIVLLDEPVNHLDIRFQYSVMDLARRLLISQGKTVVSVLHDINLAAMYADDMVILKDGQLVAQGSSEAVVTPENIKAAFEFDARMVSLGNRQICVPDIDAPDRDASEAAE